LLITPSRGFTLIEAIIYGLYNPTTGGFTYPFTTTSIIDRRRLTLDEAIADNLIDPSSTVVKDPESGGVVSLLSAIDTKLVNPVDGRIRDNKDDKEIDFIKAHEKGLILPAEQRVSFLLVLGCDRNARRNPISARILLVVMLLD
jgi:dystonin